MAEPAEHGTVNQDVREEGKETRRLDRLRAIGHNRGILNHNQGGQEMRLYHHRTDGGAEYLCSSAVEGTEEGSFGSKYIVRIDGDITKDAELLIRKEA